MQGMHLVRSNIFDKTNVVVTSAVKNTSCSRGWLRLCVECLFGMITVASFILITMMALKSPERVPDLDSRCSVHGCRVACVEAPYFEEHEEDIILAVSAADEMSCERVLLSLSRPMFVNSTIPSRWLSSLRTDIYELTISGGNLKQISSEAFMTPYTGNIHSLLLENITITTWQSDMLVGLSRLSKLCIRQSTIINISRNALEPVDDTLITLTITNSKGWDPTNLTGSSNLGQVSTVIFSSNRFGSTLNKNSFTRLRSCNTLYLDSCRISAIQAGTFDALIKIEVLYLNNNYLTVIPPDLFQNIINKGNTRPRFNLQDNLWHCQCSALGLRRLSRSGMMVVDPACYSPEKMRGKFVSNLEEYCNNNTSAEDNNVTPNPNNTYSNKSEEVNSEVNINGTCQEKSSEIYRLISPVHSLECTFDKIKMSDRAFSKSDTTLMRKNAGNDLISTTFAIRSGNFSMIEIISQGSINMYGLIWYQSQCPNEIFCVSAIPNYLRVFSVDESAYYTFCPLDRNTGSVLGEKCISYGMHIMTINTFTTRLIVYVCTGVSCLISGAIVVYALIRKYPSLLKGSKRVLFVKHKNVDALILPPKVPLRTSLVNDEPIPDFNEKGIFVMSNENENLCPNKLLRSRSMRSGKSSAPSYVSALEPTEAQLAEWRLRQQFDTISTVTSVSLDVSMYSVIADNNSLYLSLSSEPTYESLK